MMKKLGKIYATCSTNNKHSKLPRPQVDKLECIENFGIKNDKFANKILDRSVMIIGQIAYDIAKNNAINLKYGSFGENILTSFNPNSLNKGDIICINDVLLQITQNCTICSHLSCFDKKLPKLISKHRGVYCKILTSGVITKNNKVFYKQK